MHLSLNKRVNTTPPPGGGPVPTALFTRIVLLALAAASLALPAQTPAAAAPPKVTALFLSDIHLDPYSDPAKIAKLDAAPVAEWGAILAAPASPTLTQDSAALQTACPVRGVDTPDVLWQSSLAAIHSSAAHVQFATVSGDLLAHQFDCKYKTLLPAATHAEYLAFVEKTIRYVIDGLRTSLPGVPIYISLGNNDSGCTDYELDPSHDQFLALTAKIVAEALPANLGPAERDSVLRDFSAGGYFSAPLPAPLAHTKILVLDNLFLSANYATCAGKRDPAPAAAQLSWLEAELATAREHKENVWVMGHIPPGVDPYSTIRNLPRVCLGGQSKMFLGSESLAEILARYSDVVRLAIFGHTHSDEMRLLTPASAVAAAPPASENAAKGVPVKIVSSITPVNGNRPTFTLASIDPATATLTDYTVIEASNLTGVDTTWSPEYTYSTAYHQPAFDAKSVANLLRGFEADPQAASAESQAYLRNYFPGDVSAIIQFAWPQYTCAMNHDSGASFAACACKALTASPK